MPGNYQRRSKPFKAARRQHVNEAAEDYTELVADLEKEFGQARTCAIAKHLGVSHVTALRTIRRLQDEGLLVTSPHRPVTLTGKGKKLALYCKRRHRLLVDFFVSIGVPQETAENDVEGMEHHISPSSLAVIENFLAKGSK